MVALLPRHMAKTTPGRGCSLAFGVPTKEKTKGNKTKTHSHTLTVTKIAPLRLDASAQNSQALTLRSKVVSLGSQPHPFGADVRVEEERSEEER